MCAYMALGISRTFERHEASRAAMPFCAALRRARGLAHTKLGCLGWPLFALLWPVFWVLSEEHRGAFKMPHQQALVEGWSVVRRTIAGFVPVNCCCAAALLYLSRGAGEEGSDLRASAYELLLLSTLDVLLVVATEEARRTRFQVCEGGGS